MSESGEETRPQQPKQENKVPRPDLIKEGQKSPKHVSTPPLTSKPSVVPPPAVSTGGDQGPKNPPEG